MKGKMFECNCGEIVYAEESPEECTKCGEIGGFIELPEEIAKEREENMNMEEKEYEIE